MKVVEMAVADLVPYARNPRHNENAVAAVAASIQEFGFKVPIVIDRDNVIVAGHTRMKAAKQLGFKYVPCIVADDLTPDQIKAFRLADNKTAELAEWDLDLLDMELGDIELDMEPFGFELATDEDYGTDFDLPDGDRAPVQIMSFTFSDNEAEVVKEAIAAMKQSKMFERYENPLNENSNGRALFLVVSEWQARKT